MVRLITYMVATTAMILGINALEGASEIQNSLEDVNIAAVAGEVEDVAFIETSPELEEDFFFPVLINGFNHKSVDGAKASASASASAAASSASAAPEKPTEAPVKPAEDINEEVDFEEAALEENQVWEDVVKNA